MKLRTPLAAILVCVPLATGCGSDGDTRGATVDGGGCPTDPVSVIVSVDQWGDIVEQLGGDCAEVTTVIEGSSADPHDYEPTPSDMAGFDGTDLVVMNGLNYDPWAERAAETLDPKPAVVNGGDVVGLRDGDNPHIWYGPSYVHQVALAVSESLKDLSPKGAAYFDDQFASWKKSMQPYDAEVESIKAISSGKAFAASEPVFDFMAEAVGLERRTPQGYQNAALNETDPSPADVAEFERRLGAGLINVFVDNTQTEGPIPAQIRKEAEASDVPVIEVSETLPPGTDSFVEWQIEQLTALSDAISK